MRAVGLDYELRRLCCRDVAEPYPADDQVLLEVAEVGVCGTDRELARFHFGVPPAGENFLILGHEALARVAAVGSAVRDLKPGDWVAPTVRRMCPSNCQSCRRGRPDLCLTGMARDRGVSAAHGYFTRFAMDFPRDLVRVPDKLVDRAVLMEPLSVVEKAVELALRHHEPGVGTALILGAGPIGILCGLVLQLRGLDVTIASMEEDTAPRAALIRKAGMRYHHGLRGLQPADIVMEASGASEAALAAFRLMAPLGVLGLIGAATPKGELPLLDMVLKNQLVFGTVNTSPEAFRRGIEDLASLDAAITGALIERVRFSDFERTMLGPPGNAVKLVHRVIE